MAPATVIVEWEPLDPDFTNKPAHVTPERGDRYAFVEYPAYGQVVQGCFSCLDFSAHVDVVNNEVIIREWHNAACDSLEFLRPMACHGDLNPGECCPRCGSYRHCHGPLRPGESCDTCGAYKPERAPAP